MNQNNGRIIKTFKTSKPITQKFQTTRREPDGSTTEITETTTIKESREFTQSNNLKNEEYVSVKTKQGKDSVKRIRLQDSKIETRSYTPMNRRIVSTSTLQPYGTYIQRKPSVIRRTTDEKNYNKSFIPNIRKNSLKTSYVKLESKFISITLAVDVISILINLVVTVYILMQ